MGVARDIELPSLPEPDDDQIKNIIGNDEFSRKKLKLILHFITGELKTRGTKTPHIFLPYRSKIDDRKIERFLGQLFPYGELINTHNEERIRAILKSTDEFTLMCGLKYLWSRLPNGEVIGWDVYLEYKRKEREAGYPRNAFLSIMPKCLSSPAHASIVYDFLDLLVNIASHSQYNFLSGRKIAKMASLWAFNVNARREHSLFYDATRSNENTFLDGLDAWKSSSGALFHLFLSFLRAMLPDSEMEKLKLPKTLQSLLMSNSYPPSENTDSIKTMITIPCVIVRSTRPSSNPYELLSKVRHTLSFDKKDSFMSIENYTILKNIFQKESTNEIVSTLTEESRRILSTLTSQTIDSEYGIFPGWAKGGPEIDPDIPLYSQISIHDVTLQDYYIWTWLSSIGSDQSNSMKKLFGRSLVVEAGLRGFQKWLVVTEKLISSDEYTRLFKTKEVQREVQDKRVLSDESYKNMPLPAAPPVPPSKDDKEFLPKLKFDEDDYRLNMDIEDDVHDAYAQSDGDEESFIYPSKSMNNEFNDYITSLNDFDEDKLAKDFKMKSMISVDSRNASKYSGHRPPPPPLAHHKSNDDLRSSQLTSPVSQPASEFQNNVSRHTKQMSQSSFKELYDDYETEYDRKEKNRVRKPSEPFEDYHIPGVDTEKKPSPTTKYGTESTQLPYQVRPDQLDPNSPNRQSEASENRYSSSPDNSSPTQIMKSGSLASKDQKSDEERFREERRKKKKKEKKKREKEAAAAAAMYGPYGSYSYMPPGPPPPPPPPPPGLAQPFVSSPNGETPSIPPGYFPMGNPANFDTSPKKHKKKKKKHTDGGDWNGENDRSKADVGGVSSTQPSGFVNEPASSKDEGQPMLNSKIPMHLLPKIVLDSNSDSGRVKGNGSINQRSNISSPKLAGVSISNNTSKENLPPVPYGENITDSKPASKPRRKSPSPIPNSMSINTTHNLAKDSVHTAVSPTISVQGNQQYPNNASSTSIQKTSSKSPKASKFDTQPLMQDKSQVYDPKQQHIQYGANQLPTQSSHYPNQIHPKSNSHEALQISNHSHTTIPQTVPQPNFQPKLNVSPSQDAIYTQQPHVKQPHVQQPHVQQPHVQQPHIQQPHAQQPHVQQPHAQQPHVQQPHVQQPHVQQPHIQQPHAQQPHIQQPHVQQPHVQPHIQQPHGPQHQVQQQVQPYIQYPQHPQYQHPLQPNQQQYAPQAFNQQPQPTVSPHASHFPPQTPQTYSQPYSAAYPQGQPQNPPQHQYQYQQPMQPTNYMPAQPQQSYLPVPQQGNLHPNVQIVYQTAPPSSVAPNTNSARKTSEVTMLNMPSASKFNKNNRPNKANLRAELNQGFGI